MLIAETTRSAVPVFVITTVLVLELPTVALPKDNELGEIVADTVGPDPDPGFDPDPDTPVLPQPVMIGSASKTAMAHACAVFIVLESVRFLTVPSLKLNFQREPSMCNRGTALR